MLALLALLALLSYLMVNLSGNGGGDGKQGKGPAESITPGPTDGSSVISERPGGRDESGDGGAGEDDGGGDNGGDNGGEDGGGDGGPGGADGGGDGSTAAAEGGGGTAGGAAGGGFGAGADAVPAGSSMRTCTRGDVALRLSSRQESYEPGEKPVFELTAVNSGAADCKLDFGPTSAVLTIADADDDTLWESDDCPWTTERILLAVPSGGQVSRSYEWDLRRSAPRCATPQPGTAGAGSYVAELRAEGFGTAREPFELAK